MSRSKLLAGSALAVILLGCAGYWAFAPGASPAFSLLSAEERAQYESLPHEKSRSLTVNASDGPAINVSAPQGYSLASPVDFDIDVQPRGGVPVDMSSIKIEYKLGPAWINMTRTILKYASIKGSRLFAKGADLPKGQHALRVSVKDTQQRITQATVSFTVVK